MRRLELLNTVLETAVLPLHYTRICGTDKNRTCVNFPGLQPRAKPSQLLHLMRSHPDSNWNEQFCRPLPSHSDIGPFESSFLLLVYLQPNCELNVRLELTKIYITSVALLPSENIQLVSTWQDSNLRPLGSKASNLTWLIYMQK